MGPWQWLLLCCFHATLVRGTILTGDQQPQERLLRPAGWSPAPSSSWLPTPEPGASRDSEGSSAALAFLQTGDAQRLARANCSRGVTAGPAGAGPSLALRAALRAAPEALAHAANFLNMLFQTNDIREASVAEDVEWYQALVRSLAEGHPWVRRAVLALDAHPLAAKPRLMLQATKGDGEILLQDVSAAAPSLGNLSWDNEWFNALKSQRTPILRKRVLSNDLRSMETPKWQRGDSYVGEPGHVWWSPPFLECRDGRFLPTWAVTLSSAFYGLKPDLSPEFKGVVRVDVELRDVAIDQCASSPGWFADTHRCDLNSTQCVPQESRGFVLERYLCRCKPGFYGVRGVASDAWAGGAAGAAGGSRLACQPCRRGCATCEDDAPCLIQEDQALRTTVLCCQACCMLAVFLSMLVSYHFRRSKRIRTSGVILLETILFGSLLLYFPVFILYFKPSIFRCIVLRWVRMLGFTIVYGTITLKLYRVLKLFLSRTSRRVPYVSSGRVLKMLGLILLLVLWFLAAWTIGMLENIDKNIPLVIRTQTPRGLHFYICSHDRWDYMMVIAEMLFLLWGSFLCYATRAVPSAFHEPRYMSIALHNELMISAAFHVVRFIVVPSLHPDWTLLLFFAHTHGTITMTLALLFIPKFLHAGSPLREEIAAEVYEDELDMRHSGSCLNSSFASAWSEHSLDPDDIREELKKLYAQLEVHKMRRMAANNPHLPKKRSSRRSLCRSIARGSAELLEAVTRRSSGGEWVGTPARRGSSAKQPPDASSTGLQMWDDGSWCCAAAPRVSRSTEGPTRELPRGSSTPIPPREAALERETMAVTSSEPSDSESLDTAPLMCKSASAHNLLGHGQPLLPRAAPLQKSLSVVAGTRDEALLAASRAVREWHMHQLPSGLSSERSTVQGSCPAEKAAQEDTARLGNGKVQKHVTYAPIKSISIDSSHLPGRVRVAVRKTPPPPPVRYQSLGQHATLPRDSPQPPTEPPAWVGEPEATPVGMAEEDLGQMASPSRKGRLLTAASIPAQVCPWELVQEEILSQKQKAAEAADSGTPSDVGTSLLGIKPLPQKSSLRGLGLALKAFNRSRGKSIIKWKQEGEGSQGKKEQEEGSRKERLSLEKTSTVTLREVSQDLATKSPEGSSQRPSSEPTALPWPGDTVLCQHNNNAGTAWGAIGWGDNGAGQWDSSAPGTGDGETLAEEPRTSQGDMDAGRSLEPPLGVHEVPLDVGYQEAAEHPHETPEAPSSGEAQLHPWEGAQAPAVELGKDVPAASTRLSAPKEEVARLAEGLKVSSRSIHHKDHTEEEQPHAKPVTSSTMSSSDPSSAAEKLGAEVCPWGASGIPAGRGALLRQEAIASPEDSRVLPGKESPDKVLQKGDSPLEPLGPGESQGAEVALATAGKPGRAMGRQAEVCPGETRADSSSKTEICPGEEQDRAPGKGSSERDPSCPGEEPGVEKPRAKTPELLKVASEKTGSVEGRRAEVCPWETGEGEKTVRAEICPWDAEGAQLEKEGEGAEQPIMSLSAKHPALDKTSSKQGRTIDSKKSDICPWEVEGEPLAKTEVCPWEEPAAPLGKGKPGQDMRGIFKRENKPGSVGPEDIKQLPEKPHAGIPALPKSPSKESPSTESLKAEVCPWELKSSDKAEICPWESPSKKSQSTESLKAEVCPWDAPEPMSTDKAEICPWEVAAPPLGEGKARQDKDALSVESRSPSAGQETEDSMTAKMEKKTRDRESICPWESTDTETSSTGTEQPPDKTCTRSTMLPKSSSKSQSTESLKTEVCPWDAPELTSTDKAEICPWEVAAPPSGKDKARQDKDALSAVSRSPPAGQGLHKDIGESLSGKQGTKRDRESICPWESKDTEQPPEKPHAGDTVLPKSPSKKSHSTESLKADICPWEVAAPPSGKDKARQDKDVLSAVSRSPSAGQGFHKETEDKMTAKMEKINRDRKSICPWESTDTEQPPEKPRAGDTVLPKSPSKKSHSTESLKAEVCPWDAPEPMSTDKAEICPWEVAAPPPGKDKARQDKDVLSAVSRSPSAGQGFHKETEDKMTAKMEKINRDRKSICPWESTDTEQPPEKPRAGDTVLPKSPSKKSHSTESLKAEVCPWDAPEPMSTDKAEICPWEVAAPPPDKDKPRQDKDVLSVESSSPSAGQGLHKDIEDSMTAKMEKINRDRESICPWESTDTEQPPEKPRAGDMVLLKSPSKKSQSTESLKAEVCPWDALEPISTDKAEICPWEAAAPLPEDRAALGATRLPPKQAGAPKPREKSSSEHEAICPWESLGTEEPSPKTAMEKELSGKSDSIESRKSEICPWEAAEPTGTEKESFKPGVHPQGDDRASPSRMGRSKPLAEVSTVSATVLLKESKGRSESEAKHKPLCRVLPGVQPSWGLRAELLPQGASTAPTAGCSPSTGIAIAGVCPWEEAPTASDTTSTDREKTSEVCPWEVESTDAPVTLHGQARAGASPQDSGGGMSETKADVCPWDNE
ncbi:probable G-protein coupled receptor 179 [Colius striatus]|uniref:probable G-protein coupled receptor 179 n=1 Tax=Colius striatus TaxID=57412 RepID=UPI002B1DACCC|nr:probable G-protein coupled receptor 179 [Colius striatus]